MKGAGIVQFTISTPIQMVAGEGLVLACGLRQGAALGCHWHPIHSRILQVLLRTRDIKTPHRVAGRFYMVAGEIFIEYANEAFPFLLGRKGTFDREGVYLSVI